MIQNIFNLFLEASPQANQGSLLGMFLPLIIMFALMYFLAIRPQRKREQELRKQIDAMQVGDQVVTIGGITGRIFNLQGDEVTISTSVQNTLMTFKKSAVAHVISDRPASTESTTKIADSEKKERSDRKQDDKAE